MTREETIQELGEWLEQMIQNGVPSHSAKRKALATAIVLLSEETSTINEKHQLSEETPTVFIDGIGHFPKLTETSQNLTEPNNACEVDLISRQDAFGAVQDHFNADGFKGYDDGQKMMDRIKALPSADRPSGKWKYLHGSIGSYMTISCPFCGETFNDVAEWEYNFCPNCGAKMKGGAE